MIINEIFNDLRKDAKLVILMKAGFISPAVLTWHDIYLHYDILIKQGRTNREAVKECAKKFRRCEKSIYLAINKCQMEI